LNPGDKKANAKTDASTKDKRQKTKKTKDDKKKPTDTTSDKTNYKPKVVNKSTDSNMRECISSIEKMLNATQ